MRTTLRQRRGQVQHMFIRCIPRISQPRNDTVLYIQDASMTPQAANNVARGWGVLDYIDSDGSMRRYDTDGCITITLRIVDGAPVKLSAEHTVTKQQLYGAIPSSAPLDIATARALHVAAGAPRTVADALLVNSLRLDSTLFAVVKHCRRAGERCDTLGSVWRSRAEAEQEARGLFADAGWRQMRRAILHGVCVPGWYPLSPSGILADDGDSDDDSDDEEGLHMDQYADYDCHLVHDVRPHS
ncbi:hypothetical protein JKP88DRAFT_324997 [Tribonema minus]|uniref:Uncharacterized protein n=1 Tax=Tribonema minus TaxID=303371 RepID=A0A835YVB0_9STRA|nr:hypothetical protein JKP88DRAFT_324997 [Tribonema minus]